MGYGCTAVGVTATRVIDRTLRVLHRAILILTMTLGPHPFGAEAGVLLELSGTTRVEAVLTQVGGGRLLTAVNPMLFILLHNPCGTTIRTIRNETGSLKWTVVATLVSVVLGMAVTVTTTAIARLAGWV